MSNGIEQRMRIRVVLLTIGVALILGSPLYANQPADSAHAQDTPNWFQQNSSFIIPSLTFVGGVIVALIASRAMRKPAPVAPEAKPQAKVEPKPAARKPPPKPARSEAVTLLAALQREARFVDFIKEPLDGYSDAQIGAAARDVHRDCGKVLDRLLAIRGSTARKKAARWKCPPVLMPAAIA